MDENSRFPLWISAILIIAGLLLAFVTPELNAQTTIFVDKSTYTMHVMKDGEVESTMKVIVGKKSTPTPDFEDTITHVVYNPEWHVPKSIKREIERKGTFEKYGFEIRGETWVQLAGPRNALGKVKFRMTNPYHIFLHDTNTKRLFEKEKREYSHGCIRLEKPLELASILLPEIKYKRGKEQWIKLPEPVKVVIR